MGIEEMGGQPNSQAVAEVKRSKQIGDYYRNLATNYNDYDTKQKPWPDAPEGHRPAEY